MKECVNASFTLSCKRHIHKKNEDGKEGRRKKKKRRRGEERDRERDTERTYLWV